MKGKINPKDKAEEIIYKAHEAKSKAQQNKLAKEALEIYPNCSDAYLLLAENETRNLETRCQLLRKAVEAGRKDLGEKEFNEMKGHFWGFVETRPFMRAMQALSDCLFFMNNDNEAISLAKEMLELNPGDNQGMRYKLLLMYGTTKKYIEMEELLNHKEYHDEAGVEWAYGRVLISFIKHGDSKLTEKAVKKAIEANKYIPEYLIFTDKIPKSLPVSFSFNSKEEAIIYAVCNIVMWLNASEALTYLVKYATKNVPLSADKPKFKGTLKY